MAPDEKENVLQWQCQSPDPEDTLYLIQTLFFLADKYKSRICKSGKLHDLGTAFTCKAKAFSKITLPNALNAMGFCQEIYFLATFTFGLFAEILKTLRPDFL